MHYVLTQEEADAKAERRLFQRLCNAMNIIVCLLMGSCQGLMIYYQIPYYSTFMFTIQFFRRGVIMTWLLVIIGCNFCTKGFFRENFPLFARRRTRHISYGFVFAAIGIFTVQDPLTLALYQGYRENVCLAKDNCDSRFPPEVMLYIIAGMSTICLSSFPLGCINACIVWKFFNKFKYIDDEAKEQGESEKSVTKLEDYRGPSANDAKKRKKEHKKKIAQNKAALKTAREAREAKEAREAQAAEEADNFRRIQAAKDAKDANDARIAAEVAAAKAIDEAKRRNAIKKAEVARKAREAQEVEDREWKEQIKREEEELDRKDKEIAKRIEKNGKDPVGTYIAYLVEHERLRPAKG